MGLAGVVKLVEAAVSINCVNGNTEEQEPKAEQERDSPRHGAVPCNAFREIDQLL
jgi:hypothetical protein